MAVGFAGMARVFEGDSTGLIENELASRLDGLLNRRSRADFEQRHEAFCDWFTKRIRRSRVDGPASWGHAAKVLDIALKVCVYYCQLPNPDRAAELLPLLHAPLDTAIVNHLLEEGTITGLDGVWSLGDVTRPIYAELQHRVDDDILLHTQGNILPVEWDDIRWRELNNKS